MKEQSVGNKMIHAFIPVRGGSKGIPLKNIKPLGGKPLVQWVIDSAKYSKKITRIVVATDSFQIEQCVTKHNKLHPIEFFPRTEEDSNDTASSEDILIKFAKSVDPEDIVVFIQATSPLISSKEINTGIEYVESGEADSCVSVVCQKRFTWDHDGNPNYDIANRPRRQDYDGLLVENGAFYISKAKDIISSGCRVSGNIKTVMCDKSTYTEIDEISDWNEIEAKLSKNKNHCISDIKLFVTDVDGTLTDGKVLVDKNGNTQKSFNIKDGLGMSAIRQYGIGVAWITGSEDLCIKERASHLKIEDVYYSIHNKHEAILDLCSKYEIETKNIAYIGDDVNDIFVLRHVGLSFCPVDAVQAVRDSVDVVVSRNGGEGAVREAIDFILDQ